MMLTPCAPSAGPTGGAGLAAPARIWSLISPETFFLGGISSGPSGWEVTDVGATTSASQLRSDLLDLAEVELDRSLPAEDGDQNLELLGVGVDLGDRGRQRRERTVDDGDGLADLEVDGAHLSDRTSGRLLVLDDRGEDVDDLVDRERRGGVGVAHESGDAGGVAHDSPRLVGELHAHQHVTGELVALAGLALAVLDLGEVLLRNLDLEDVVLHVEGVDPALQVRLHALLVAGIGVDDVPVAERGDHRLAELGDRVARLGVLVDRVGVSLGGG